MGSCADHHSYSNSLYYDDVDSSEAEFTDDESGSSAYGSDQETDEAAPSACESSFPLFLQLPFELRCLIWGLYCPDIHRKSRILTFTVMRDRVPSTTWYVVDGSHLVAQTLHQRRLQSIHSETRSLALGVFPDRLDIDSCSGIVRFNKSRDIIYMTGEHTRFSGPEIIRADFAAQVENLAVVMAHTMDTEPFATCVNFYKNLKSVYFGQHILYCQKDQLAWCTSDFNHHYEIDLFKDQEDSEMNGSVTIKWIYPNIRDHKSWADSLPPIHSSRWTGGFRAVAKAKGVDSFPMIMFDGECEVSQKRFRELMTEQELKGHTASHIAL